MKDSKLFIQSIPINQRSSHSKSFSRLIIFNSLFFISLFLLHSTQLIFFPLIFYKFGFNHLFWKLNSFAKQIFGIVLIVFTQIFGPTKLVITVDDDIDLRKLVKCDQFGRIISLDLPKRSVIMANHQIYADWLYIWCLAYLAEIHGSIIIILKASLKWVPIVGPAMQLFSFIFLNRSWSSDKLSLIQQLNTMSNQTTTSSKNQLFKSLTLLIFPEGTLVSPLTRPISQKYAEKTGFTDLKHCLLPRSTGTLFCIRTLSRSIPDLQLIDLTIGYPGIPAYGNGQDFYTLQSIFGYGHSPPKVHIHLKIIPINSIPIGTSHLNSSSFTNTTTSSKLTEIIDPTSIESIEFDKWLREKWIEKDLRLEKFYETGSMIYSNISTSTSISKEKEEKEKEKDEDEEDQDDQDEEDQDEEDDEEQDDIVMKRKLITKVRLRGNYDWLILLGLYTPGIFLVWIGSIWFMIGFNRIF